MKRFLLLLIFALSLMGCGGDFPSEIEGEIFKVEEDSVHIAIFGDDPEAEYPVYEVFFDDNTIIEEEVLEVGDWVVAEIRDRDKQVASKVVVEEK